MTTNPMLLADFYKIAHRKMYPPDTTKVYSTWTPRGSRVPGVDWFVWFGLQRFLRKMLLTDFQQSFFESKRSLIVDGYARMCRHALSDPRPEVAHIEALHDLGYLPLRIRGLDEGMVVPLRTPTMTIENTAPEFFWLTNYVETLLSCELWLPCNSATLARHYRKLFDAMAVETGGQVEFCQFQGHDFSMRGMGSLDAAISSGLGHLTSFVGTDTIPAIEAAELYYDANIETELVGCSVPASEHSVQCAYGNDEEYIRHLITKVHPSGIVSIVCDGYDFWDVITRVIPSLKREIMARDGKVVVRPDSGDPVKIMIGDPEAATEHERKGAFECLWDTFGGTTVSGFRTLDSHIGLIYGDAINYDRAERTLRGLAKKRFASTNPVFGIGSFTYQFVTRDTFGQALKSTLVVRDGVERAIFKAPKTDDGLKNSQRGRVAVFRDADGNIVWRDGLRLDEHAQGNLLQDRFMNGHLTNQTTLADIRARIAA